MTIPIRKYLLSIFVKEQTIFELEENIWAVDYIISTFFTENLLYNHVTMITIVPLIPYFIVTLCICINIWSVYFFRERKNYKYENINITTNNSKVNDIVQKKAVCN